MAFWKKSQDTSDEADSMEAEAPLAGATPSSVSTSSRVAMHEEDLMRRFGRVRSALSPGTIIQGKLSFDSPVRIDGKLLGEVFSSQTLLIGPSGQVDAQIEAATVVVLGKLVGGIIAKDRIEIMPGSEVNASLSAPVLVIHEGAWVQGRCEMGVDKAKSPGK